MAEPLPRRHIVLLGPMGGGKTTIGKALAEDLGVPFADSDDLVADGTGSPSADVAAAMGVAELHRIEREVLLAALDSPPPTVIAAAASVVDDEKVRAALQRHDCVWVDADPATRARRLRGESHRRTLAPDEQRLLDERRRPYLDDLALVAVDGGVGPPGPCVEAIREALVATS